MMTQPTQTWRRRPSRRRRGAAAVEMAFAAPVLLLIVFGMMEIGQGMLVKQLLSTAARDGARAATLEGVTAHEVQVAVTEFLESSSVYGTTVVVSPMPLSSIPGGSPVTVEVSIPFSEVSWMPSPFFLGGAVLKATVTMRREVFTTSSS